MIGYYLYSDIQKSSGPFLIFNIYRLLRGVNNQNVKIYAVLHVFLQKCLDEEHLEIS